MPDRDIICKDCGCYLGVIRDGNIRKDIVYMCQSCYGPEFVETKEKISDSQALYNLQKIFGMKI